MWDPLSVGSPPTGQAGGWVLCELGDSRSRGPWWSDPRWRNLLVTPISYCFLAYKKLLISLRTRWLLVLLGPTNMNVPEQSTSRIGLDCCFIIANSKYLCEQVLCQWMCVFTPELFTLVLLSVFTGVSQQSLHFTSIYYVLRQEYSGVMGMLLLTTKKICKLQLLTFRDSTVRQRLPHKIFFTTFTLLTQMWSNCMRLLT